MKRTSFACLLFVLAAQVHAAKFPVMWTNPDKNTDGSALTDLTSIEIEWGTCNGNLFGTLIEAALIATDEAGKQMSYMVTVSGQAKVCIRAFAYAATGAKSDSSNVAVKTLLPTPGKPVTLDQPVILNFKQEK